MAVDGFEGLKDEGDVDEDVLKLKTEYDKIFLNCILTPEGKRMIDTLYERHVNVPVYRKGDSLEAVAYRQGMSDLITNIIKASEEAMSPIETRS